MKWNSIVNIILTMVLVTAVCPKSSRGEATKDLAFQSLQIDMSGMWIGQHILAIQADGKYTFDLKERRKGQKDYRAVYRLGPDHLQRLGELLAETGWLTAPAGHKMATDVTTYKMTLDRKGHKTTAASTDVQEDAYKELIRYIRRIDRQETLLYQALIPDQRAFVAHQLHDELGALAAKRKAMSYAPILDYRRFVPVCSEWLAKPQGLSSDTITTAAELMAYLKVESQRSNLEAIARGHAPDDPQCQVRSEASRAAVTALGQLGSGPSLKVLESLAAHKDYFVRAAVAEALLGVAPTEAIPILKRMTTDTRAAAWALIRLGDKAEPAIVEMLLEGPMFPATDSMNLIREYYEHWKELPAPPSPAIVSAIQDRARAMGGPDEYGREVLKLAGSPFVAGTPWQDLQAKLSLMAAKGQESRKKLLLRKQFGNNEVPDGFLKNAQAGNLKIRRVVADRTDALAYVADQKGEINYIVWLGRDGLAWDITCGWKVTPETAQDRLKDFLKNNPKAKEVTADDRVEGRKGDHR